MKLRIQVTNETVKFYRNIFLTMNNKEKKYILLSAPTMILVCSLSIMLSFNQQQALAQGSKELSISINVAKDPVSRGSAQTIDVTVSDANSNQGIQGAKLDGTVKYATATTKSFSGITDSSGKIPSFTWRIGGNSKPGIFTVTVTASAEGYKEKIQSTTFQVTPAT